VVSWGNFYLKSNFISLEVILARTDAVCQRKMQNEYKKLPHPVIHEEIWRKNAGFGLGQRR
jgi:hypothetical protein